MFSNVLAIVGFVGAMGIPAFLTLLVERVWYPHVFKAGAPLPFWEARADQGGTLSRRQRQYLARLLDSYPRALQFRR
jgi:hypothetical protein